MTIPLVNLEQAKVHLRRTDTAADYDIESKALQASAILMNYLKLTAIPDEWMTSTSPIEYDIPENVQLATLLMTGELFMNREASAATVLSQSVKDLLVQYWDPALA